MPVIGVGLLATATGLLTAVQVFACVAAALCLTVLATTYLARRPGRRRKGVPTVNTTHLTRAYRDLVAAASAIDAPRADADWTLAHLALSDEMLAEAAERLLAGEDVVVDNRAAMDETAIAELIATTSHAERVALVHRNGAALTNVVGRIPETTAARSVRIRLVDRTGRQVTDTEVTWNRLISMRAEEHLPGHTARLTAVSGAASATRP